MVKATELICPLRLSAQEGANPDLVQVWGNMVANGHLRCLGQSCAWFVYPPGLCAATAIAGSLAEMVDSRQEMDLDYAVTDVMIQADKGAEANGRTFWG